MENAKYTWVWKDDESIHINQSDTLENIIGEIFIYYSDDTDDELDIDSTIMHEILRFNYYMGEFAQNYDYRKFTWMKEETESRITFDIPNDEYSVAHFLECVARAFGRNDQFRIIKNK